MMKISTSPRRGADARPPKADDRRGFGAGRHSNIVAVAL
jgi:hypothetical protein